MPARRKSVELSIKKEAIEWIATEGGGVPSRAVRHFRTRGWRISPSSYRQWWHQREQILASFGSRRRLEGAGRRPVLGEAEDRLVDMIYDVRLRREKVTREWIAEMARQLFYESRTEEEHEENPIRFTASDPWVASFMARNGFSLRRRTNLTTLTDDVLVDRALSYMKFLKIHKPEMNMDRTVLMDETAIYFEDPRNQTVDQVGLRHIVIRSTGFASMRITAALAVTASGKKLPPLIIWKRTTRGAIERLGGCYVAFQQRAWVDQELLLQWLDWYFPPVITTSGQWVVWDSMRAHIGKRVKQRCEEKDVKMAVIPGGLTPYLQAGDVGIYKSFKDKMSVIIDEWKRSDAVQYTRGGNPRPPSIETVAGWVSTAWRQVPDEVVKNSIEICGFSDEVGRWHISNHDVYGARFNAAWDASQDNEEQDNEEHDFSDALDELNDAFDDVIIHEE
jgi:DDE superfamily endonuclease/Tc5 transposase DNA-binding domain